MKTASLILALSLGLATACAAADKNENNKNSKIDELTSIQLGGSSLKFEGEAPKKTVAPDDPAGMSNFKKESTGPFLGLRFSTPLSK
jgi:hypothetical protein